MKKALKVTGIVLACIVVVAILGSMFTGIKPLSLGLHDPVYQSGGAALAGYDVVSYFQGTPLQGKEQFQHEWKKTKWLFSSESNMREFQSDPERLTPQFGAYCSYAVSTGFSAPGDPTIWLVHKDKLYIFSNDEVKNEFLKDPQAIIESCSQRWKG